MEGLTEQAYAVDRKTSYSKNRCLINPIPFLRTHISKKSSVRNIGLDSFLINTCGKADDKPNKVILKGGEIQYLIYSNRIVTR